MIQRVQTLWLLLVTALGVASLKTSFFQGSKLKDAVIQPAEVVTASYNIMLMVSTIAMATLAFLSIFLFSNRKLQIKVVFAALFLSIITILLYYWQSKAFTASGTFTITAILPLSNPIWLIIALRHIYKDEKLIKSLDRLR